MFIQNGQITLQKFCTGPKFYQILLVLTGASAQSDQEWLENGQKKMAQKHQQSRTNVGEY